MEPGCIERKRNEQRKGVGNRCGREWRYKLMEGRMDGEMVRETEINMWRDG